ncbi:MAG TPA: response regulator [Humisphaera sp.]|nr:response regulator [Humisphaera sp.]
MADVLVVDDESDGCDVLSRFLARDGHTVRSVPNGREALAALVTHTPDVVVLDLLMPEMDGVSFLEVIRCYLRWSSIPVIVLTALPSGVTVNRARELGVHYVFHKAAFQLSDLGEAVNDSLGQPHAGVRE